MNIKAHQIGMHLQAMYHTINQRKLHYYAPKHPESFILRNYQYVVQSPKQSHTYHQCSASKLRCDGHVAGTLGPTWLPYTSNTTILI
jgi:hypothetical protein